MHIYVLSSTELTNILVLVLFLACQTNRALPIKLTLPGARPKNSGSQPNFFLKASTKFCSLSKKAEEHAYTA